MVNRHNPHSWLLPAALIPGALAIALTCLIFAAVFIGRSAPEPGVVLVFNYEPAGIFAIDTNRLVAAHISYPPNHLIVDIPNSAISESRFVYETSRSGKLEIAVLEGTAQALYETGKSIEDRLPALSPDGTRLAFWTAPEAHPSSRFQNWTLKVRNLATGEETSLTDQLAILPYGHPIWSNDGSRFIVRYYRAGIDEGMFVADIATRRLISLQQHIHAGGEITWAPDGSHLAYQYDVSGNADIYAYDINASTLTQLTDHPSDDREPDWSPDGSQIAFVSDRDGIRGVYVMDADGENVRILAPNVWSPRWSPDGKHIAVLKREGSDSVLHVINVETGEMRRIVPLTMQTTFVGWMTLPD